MYVVIDLWAAIPKEQIEMPSSLGRRSLLLPGAELPLVKGFGLLNDLFPLPSILDAGYPVLDLQLANVLFDVIPPSVLGISL